MTDQVTSREGLIEIAGREAIVLTPYWDTHKPPVLTIGIGHTAAAGAPDPKDHWGKPLTFEQVLAAFRDDIRHFEADVRRAFTRPLTQAQFDAAVSFHYNTGQIRTASWVRAFNAGNLDDARRRFMLWNKPDSIVGRRTEEQHQFFDGVYTHKGVVSLLPADAHGHILWGSGKTVDLSQTQF